MEKRLIDANALQQEFDRYIQRNRERRDTPNRYCADVAEVLRDFLVETAPTVNAAEVVYCDKCRFVDDCNQRVSVYGSNRLVVFCSRGERKQDESE